MIDFTEVVALTIPEGPVACIRVGDQVIWQKVKLPAGYKRIPYIETADEQYIDTGFIPNNKSRAVMDFVSATDEDYNDILGCRSSTTSKGFALSTTAKKWRFGYGATVETSALWDTERHTVDINRNVLSLDGEVIHTAEKTEFTCAYSLCLGAIKAAKMYLGHVRIYACKIYDDGVLVRDLVPCQDAAGVAGMYDKVTGVFYGNAGTGDFIVA